jgi:hypothetical protein
MNSAAVKTVIDRAWEIFNLGFTIDGMYIKFWYLPAFYLLIRMVLKLLGLIVDAGKGIREAAGRSARYKSKKEKQNERSKKK